MIKRAEWCIKRYVLQVRASCRLQDYQLPPAPPPPELPPPQLLLEDEDDPLLQELPLLELLQLFPLELGVGLMMGMANSRSDSAAQARH
jgi:hypothetical protein